MFWGIYKCICWTVILSNLETVGVLDFAAHKYKISDISESGDGAQKYFRFLKFLIIAIILTFTSYAVNENRSTNA
jgi:hypothetical protein